MIKTRTDLLTVALLSSLGIYASACGARTEEPDTTKATLTDAGGSGLEGLQPATDPSEGQNTGGEGTDDVGNEPAPPKPPAVNPAGSSVAAPGMTDPGMPQGSNPAPSVNMPPVNMPAEPPVSTGEADGGAQPSVDADGGMPPVVPVPVMDAGGAEPGAEAGCGATQSCEPTSAPGCDGATPVMYGAVDTGLVQCDNGVVHRPAQVECVNLLAAHVVPVGSEDVASECTSNADCTDAAYGYCGLPPSLGGAPLSGPTCMYGCLADADCGSGQFCLCGDPVGSCVDSPCSGAADCEGEFLCSQYYDRIGIGCGESPQFACQTAADVCGSDQDCDGASCTLTDGARSCVEVPPVACGRPFLVAGEQRLAAASNGVQWQVELGRPDLSDTLSPAERAVLGQAWSDVGLMEHASIAAFARFTLQLMHLGAPAALVQASIQATSDEARHALSCFTLASSYLGRNCGPGALSMDAALDAVRLRDVVALAVREGCVGETIAALEASESAAHCQDTRVRDVLRGIAADEQRHAELAWQFVAWALERDVSLAQDVRGECERALAEFRNTGLSCAVEFDTAPHGMLTSSLRAQVRTAAVRDVVLPCMSALLAKVNAPAAISALHA
jgi:hypothetical protein